MKKLLLSVSIVALAACNSSPTVAQPGGVPSVIQPVTKGDCAVFAETNQSGLVDLGPCSGSGGTPANPTATIGAAAVNGSASTFMRSDAAPALPATLPALDGSLLTNLNAAPPGKGAVVTTSQSPNAADFAACKTFVMNNSSLTFNVPKASTLQSNGGCFFITVLSNTVTLHPADSGDSINGGTAGANLTLNANQTVMVTVDTGTGIYVGNVSSSGGGITVGTTTITSGTSGRVPYNNSGVYGEKAVSGTGNVILQTAPNLIGNVLLSGAETATTTPLFLFQPDAATTPGAFDNDTTVGINCPNGHTAFEIIPNNGGAAKAYIECDGGATFDSLSAGAGGVTVNGIGVVTSSAFIGRNSAPTLTGTCTTGSQTGAATVGTFTATCTSQTVIITFPAGLVAPNGWICRATDLSTVADSLVQTTGSLASTTSCTLTGTTGAADRITFSAEGF